MAKTTKKDKSAVSFEDSMAELEQILEQMQKEETTLDKSIELYARAAQLVQLCNEKLNNAQLKIEEISKTVDTMEGQHEL